MLYPAYLPVPEANNPEKCEKEYMSTEHLVILQMKQVRVIHMTIIHIGDLMMISFGGADKEQMRLMRST